MKAPSSMRVPTHLYVFCGLGVLGGLLLFLLPLMVVSSFMSEQARFEACHSGTRTDCNPSIFWYLNDWVEKNATETTTSVVPLAATSTQDMTATTSTTSTIAVPAAPTSTKATSPSKRKRK